MKTLYVSDLDGTLLNNESKVSETSDRILSELTAKGALITAATARTPATVVPLLGNCLTNVPYIVMTGAATFNPASLTYNNIVALNVEKVAEAAYIFASYDVNPFFYHLDDRNMLTAFHAPAMTPLERRFYEERTNSALKHFTFNPILPQGGKYPLIFAIGETEKIEPLADEFRMTGNFQVSFYPDLTAEGNSMIELFATGVSKALATTLVAGQTGVERIVAFGDNLNDLSLFEVADVAVAVANAHPEVRRVADIVIGSNDEDSVARFIAQDFEGRLTSDHRQ